MKVVVDTLTKAMSPLDVRITTEYKEDGYWINLDGTKAYPDEHIWDLYSDGFLGYVKYRATKAGIPTMKVERIANSIVAVHLGTLFDMIAIPPVDPDA